MQIFWKDGLSQEGIHGRNERCEVLKLISCFQKKRGNSSKKLKDWLPDKQGSRNKFLMCLCLWLGLNKLLTLNLVFKIVIQTKRCSSIQIQALQKFKLKLDMLSCQKVTNFWMMDQSQHSHITKLSFRIELSLFAELSQHQRQLKKCPKHLWF